MKYAVSLKTLMWVNADSREEAIDRMRENLAAMDEDELNHLEFDVVDSVPEEDWNMEDI